MKRLRWRWHRHKRRLTAHAFELGRYSSVCLKVCRDDVLDTPSTRTHACKACLTAVQRDRRRKRRKL